MLNEDELISFQLSEVNIDKNIKVVDDIFDNQTNKIDHISLFQTKQNRINIDNSNILNCPYKISSKGNIFIHNKNRAQFLIIRKYFDQTNSVIKIVIISPIIKNFCKCIKCKDHDTLCICNQCIDHKIKTI